MTVYQLRNKIKKLKEQIVDCEEEIINCRRKRELREEVLFRVQSKRDTFEGFFCEQKSRIQKAGESIPNMSFIARFKEEFVGILEGKEYQKAIDGYGQAEWSLRTAMESLRCRENDLRYEIHIKEAELESLQRELRYMEQE